MAMALNTKYCFHLSGMSDIKEKKVFMKYNKMNKENESDQ